MTNFDHFLPPPQKKLLPVAEKTLSAPVCALGHLSQRERQGGD